MGKFLYGTPLRRIITRLAEIFVITGLVGVFTSPVLESIVPPLLAGIVAAITKALRELLSRTGKSEE